MSQASTNSLNTDINHLGIITGSSGATGITDNNYRSNSFENDGSNIGLTPSISTSSTEYDEQEDQNYEGGFDPTISPTELSDVNNNNDNRNEIENNANNNANNNLIEGVAVWQPDEDVTNCCICHSSFTFFHRKHHCRKCGRIVCGDCSSVFTNYLPSTYVVCPPSQVFLESPHVPHRTCDDCVDELDMIRRALRRNNTLNVLNSLGNNNSNNNNNNGANNRFSDNASTILPPEIAKNVKDITHRTTTLLLDDESRTNSSSRSSIRDFNRQIGTMSPILTQRSNNNNTSNKNNGSSNVNINTNISGNGNSNNNINGNLTSDQDTDMDLCPICAKNLKGLSEEKKEKHIDDCLTSAEFSGSPDTKRNFNRMLVYNIPLPLSEKEKMKSSLKNKTNSISSNTNNTPISSLNPKEPIPDYMISRVLDIHNGVDRGGSISSSSDNNNSKTANGVNTGSISTVRVPIGSIATNKSSSLDGSDLNRIVGGSSLDTINNNSSLNLIPGKSRQSTTGLSDEVYSDYNIDEIISPSTGENNNTFSFKDESDHEDEEDKENEDDEDDYPECVICFEPLKPGDKVGRLECLCVFHYKCIKGWFERKGASECPVHAIHMN